MCFCIFYRVICKDNPSDESYTCHRKHREVARAKESGRELQNHYPQKHWFVQPVLGFLTGEGWKHVESGNQEMREILGQDIEICGALVPLDEFLKWP